MKITRSDGEKLVIVDFPYIVGGGVMIVALAILGSFVWQVAHGGIQKVEWAGQIFCFALFFLFAARVFKRSVFEFDITRRQLVWSRVSMFGRKSGTFPFDQIKLAFIDARADDDIIYQVSLMTTGGVLPLNTTPRSGIARECKIVRDSINQTLGVPLDPEQEDPDIRALVASRQIMLATAMVRQRRKCSLAEARRIVEAMGRPG